MPFKYCPKCGGRLAKKIINGHYRLQCSKCDFVFYQNSKPTASALIIDKDKVLLGKRRINPSKGKWDIIGGFLEEGEHPEKGVKREVREETGLEIELMDMLGFFMDVYSYATPVSTLNICYVAKATDGKMKPADDISELRWFKIREYPKNIAFKNGEQMLKRLEKWHSKIK